MSTPVVTQTDTGEPREISNKWGEKRTVTINREWKVEVDGVEIGRVRYAMITRERRTPGKRYVNARWQSPGWEYKTSGQYWFEGYTKHESIDRVVQRSVLTS